MPVHVPGSVRLSQVECASAGVPGSFDPAVLAEVSAIKAGLSPSTDYCHGVRTLTPSLAWSHILGPGMMPRVVGLWAVPTAPETPVHRSKASGGRDWVSPRGPQASLGSFRRSARTLALAVRVV